MPFCRTCFYDLRELPAGHCPECGAAFDPDLPETILNRPSKPRTVISLFVGFVVLLLVLVWVLFLGGDWLIYADIPSLVMVLGVLTGGLLISHGFVTPWVALGHVFASPREAEQLLISVSAFRRAGHLCWAGGVIGFLSGGIAMLADLSDPASIGVGLGVAMLAPLYGAVLAELLFFPLADALVSRSHLPMANRQSGVGMGRGGWLGRLAGAVIIFGCMGLVYVLAHSV